MDYNTIIGMVTTLIFGWLFIALAAQSRLTFKDKTFFYVFSVWLGTILSFSGLALSLYDDRIAVALCPYVLAACGLIYTALDYDYYTKANNSNEPGWIYQKAKLFKTLAGTIFIVFLVFLYFNFRNEYNRSQEKEVVTEKLDSIDTKIDKNNASSLVRYKHLTAKVDRNNTDIKEATKEAKKAASLVAKDTKRSSKSLDKKATSIKQDTKEIKEKVNESKKSKENYKEIEPKKKKFWLF